MMRIELEGYVWKMEVLNDGVYKNDEEGGDEEREWRLMIRIRVYELKEYGL